ncbi:MAG: pyridoxal phosphate-dependent decarboxylase family protein, partial [Alphaproteobacteria bacterium]
FRTLWGGIELADSIVFNPHKWLGAQFDCSIQFLRKPELQLNTLKVQPEYLKTIGHDDAPNFSEWTIPLGRRFRALKIWFLIRAYGLEGLQTMIRNHVFWAEKVCEEVRKTPGLEIITEPALSLFTFAAKSNSKTINLLEKINADGRIYLTQTKIKNRTVIRFTAGTWQMAEADADAAISVIRELHSN